MNKTTIISIILIILMTASFIASTIFFSNSNIVNLESGKINETTIQNIKNYFLNAISFQNSAIGACENPDSPECQKLLNQFRQEKE